MLILTISGVSAENIDETSSVVTESPVSADLDTSLSSCNAQDSDLSSYESYDSFGWSGYSSDSLQSFGSDNSYIGKNYDFSNSFDSYGSYEYIGCFDSVNTQVAYGSYDTLVSCDLDDSYVCLESFDVSQINEQINYGGVGVLTSTQVVDNEVILKNYNSFSDYGVVIDSTDNLDEINIFDSATQYLTRYKEFIELNIDDSIISEVTIDMETSESYKFSSYVGPQGDNLLKFTCDGTVLELVACDLLGICQTSEPVFDSILISSGYISDDEVYFGTISDSDRMLLESIGAENVILFASLAENWNSTVTKNVLNVTLNGKISQINLDGYKVANALLKYYPSTNELYISLIGESDNEDEHSHVINDTNSHGLDYAYIKHVNVIYKDMPNLIVLTSSGYVSNKRSTAGSWDSLNDVLGSRMSSETLLPDHKAIWTPLLLLLQQDLQESIVNSHADDNEDKINKVLTQGTNNSTNNESNSSGNKSHFHGWCNHNHKHHGHHGCYPGPYFTNSVVTADLNEHDNSTDDKNESSNATSTGKGSTGTPKSDTKGGEPTYTLVYAIIGIIMVSLLFNSSYMKRDD